MSVQDMHDWARQGAVGSGKPLQGMLPPPQTKIGIITRTSRHVKRGIQKSSPSKTSNCGRILSRKESHKQNAARWAPGAQLLCASFTLQWPRGTARTNTAPGAANCQGWPACGWNMKIKRYQGVGEHPLLATTRMYHAEKSAIMRASAGAQPPGQQLIT